MQPARVVIIGYGLGGQVFHAPLVAATSGMVVAGIVTADPQRQQLARERFPHATIFASADELWPLADQFDLIVVTTPNRWHVPLGLAALGAGLSVVIDKPVALTEADFQLLIEASQQTGKPVIPFQNRRWDGDFLTLRQLIQQDWLGPIVRFESHFDRFRPVPKGAWRDEGDPADGGGLLYDLGSHLIDQAIQLFGVPAAVYAELPHRRPTSQVDDDSFVALHCAHGVIAHLYFSQIARIAGPRFVLRGQRGTFLKYGLDPQEDALARGYLPTTLPHWGEEPRDQWGRLLTERNGLVFDGPIQTLPGDYATFYAQVYAMLDKGTPPPVLLSEALQTQRVIQAAQQSHAAQRVVALPTV